MASLTFWLRPAFTLRVANRFQRVAGFDRAMALASAALTALIPCAILIGSLLSHLGNSDIADRIVNRYGLTGGGASAVKDVLATTDTAGTGGDVFSLVFLVISLLSFSRSVQRLFERTWDLRPLSVRNTRNGLVWTAGLIAYVAANGWLHALIETGRGDIAASIVCAPLTGVFFVWGGWVLSAKRIPWRDLLPFGSVITAVSAGGSIVAALYLPRLFDSYADRYGSIGAVFAMLSALFCAMVALVAAAALGHEIRDELARIQRGERPPDDEVRRQWRELRAQGAARWRTAREQHPGPRLRHRTNGNGNGNGDEPHPDNGPNAD